MPDDAGNHPGRRIGQRAPHPAADVRWRVLVEGESDAAAVAVLARRLGYDLAGVVVVPMGGVTNVGHHLRAAAAAGVTAAGLYDAGEERFVRRALAALDGGRPAERAADLDLAARGFFACDADLEDELIRACGADGVLDVLAAHGDLARFRTFQGQPFQRPRPVEAQLHRFLGTTSGRKLAYASRLAAVVPLERTPTPLRRLLERVVCRAT